MNIHVTRTNSLNVNRGLYTSWMGNALSDVNANALISEGAAYVTTILPHDDAEYAYDSNGNVIGLVSGSSVIPISEANRYISTFLPLNQSGGSSVLPTDYSGKSVAISYGAGVSTPWANAGYFTSDAGTQSYLSVPNSAVTLNMNSDSFIVSFTLNKATEAGAGGATLMGCSNGSSEIGFYILVAQTSHASANKIGVRVYANGTSQLAATFGTQVASDATDRRVLVAYDAVTKILTHYVDGVLSYTSPALSTISTDIITTNFRVGQTTTGTSVAAKFAGFNFVKFTSSGLPINITELIAYDAVHKRTGLADQHFFL